MAVRWLAVVMLVGAAPASAQTTAGESGITGQVLQPDGAPVTQGSVLVMRSAGASATAPIDRNGNFRIVPDAAGTQSLFISVPGLAPYRAIVTVPASRAVKLPPIALSEASYLRARIVTAEGEPLAATGLRRRSIDAFGATIPDPLGHTREQLDADGALVLGPLPRGKLLWALDRPPFAPTRLPDVIVTGTQPMIDRGVIVIRPAARVQIDLSAADGTPVTRHEVWIEDAMQPSPLAARSLRSDAAGRATFEGLAPGRYRVWTQTADPCGLTPPLAISRLVSSSTNDTATRLVIGGRAHLRIMSAVGPVSGRTVFVSPDVSSEPPWRPSLADIVPPGQRSLLPKFSRSWCGKMTDTDGRVTVQPVPPGPSEVRVSLFNSSYFTRVNVPDGDREMVIVLPEGLLPVRVTDRMSAQPVGFAQLTWTGGGGRVEAFANPNGDALLESVGATGGTLAVTARQYRPVEGVFEETPGVQQDVALTSMPGSLLTVRVATAEGKPMTGVVVELAGDPVHFVTTDRTGVAAFTNVPDGTLRFTAHAEGFSATSIAVAEDGRSAIIITLLRAAQR